HRASTQIYSLSLHDALPISYLLDKPEMIDPAWLIGKKRVGVTAGASAPEVLVNQVIQRLQELGVGKVRALDGVEENIAFPLPREDRKSTRLNSSHVKISYAV